MKFDPQLELRRLLRRSKPGTGGSAPPWWLSWIINAGITAAVVYGIAVALDYWWLHQLGRPAWAVCGLLGLLPFGLAINAGIVVMIVGGIAALLGKRMAGVMILILGALLYSMPELILGAGFTPSCPWIGI